MFRVDELAMATCSSCGVIQLCHTKISYLIVLGWITLFWDNDPIFMCVMIIMLVTSRDQQMEGVEWLSAPGQYEEAIF